MKKLLCLIAFTSTIQINSQSNILVKNFDLESIGKQKGWGFFSGFKNDEGKLVIKLGQPICSLEKEADASAYLYTFKGVGWKFQELQFDADLSYQSSVEKEFGSTMEALAYEPVWGGKYVTITNTGTSELFGTEFIGKKTVIPTFAFGSKLVAGNIYGKKGNGISRGTFGNSGVGCSELPDFQQLNSVIPLSVNGEIWTGIRGFPTVGGGVALFHVGGSYKTKDQFHYVLNEYNEKLEVVKSLVLDFDYMSSAQIVRVKVGEGKWDYIIVLQASEAVSESGIRNEAADFAEFVYVDGQTLEEKFRSDANLPFTNWFIRHGEIAPDGSIYVLGPAGKNNEKYFPGVGGNYTISDVDAGSNNLYNNIKKTPNYQIARIKDGKVFNITGTDLETATTKVVELEGTKTKTSLKPSFNVPSASFFNVWDPNKISKEVIKYYFKNSKIIVCFQPYTNRSSAGVYEFGNCVTAIFDANGMLESYIIKPEKNFAVTDEFFGTKGKMLYVAYYDLETVNNKISDGVYSPNKIPRFIGANLQLTKIDINTTTNKTQNVELLGTNEWAVAANNPVLLESDEEIVFLAKPISQSVKDSEFLLIKVEK